MFTGTMTITSGGTDSTKLDLKQDYTIVELSVPVMDGSNLYVYVSNEIAGTYRILNQIDGSGSWALTLGASEQTVTISEGAGFPFSCLYVVSDAAETPAVTIGVSAK